MADDYTVYRCYDEADRLLYIGCTYSLDSRCANHRNSSEWWPEVRKIEVERFPDKASAIEAERAAIRAEDPIHNRIRYPLPATQAYVIVERERTAS